MTVDVPDADFTPNPDRAIWVRGELSKSLLETLRPQIQDLTSQSREPITVFVDSCGGRIAVSEEIVSLLRSRGKDDESPCTIITVALSKALSAAADLLSAGDFAIATPGSTLLYHGGHLPTLDLASAKWVGLMAHGMSSLNEKRAVSLARRSVPRFRFIVKAVRAEFDQVRAEAKNPGLYDLKCFQMILHSRLSPAGQQVLTRATANCGAYHGLLNCFRSRMRKVRSAKRADVQKAMLNASVAFEFHTNARTSNWSLSNGGLRRISECFFFLDEFFGSANGNELSSLCESQALRRRDLKNQGDDYLSFLPFFLALGGALQVGENEITATDALWLGLIDTVRADIPALATS